MSASKVKGKGRAVTGIVMAMAITAGLCALYALLVKNGKCSQEHSDVVISAVIALSVMLSAIASNAGQGRSSIYGLAVGVIYAAVLVSIPLLAYPTEVDWLKIFRIIAVAAVSGLIGGNVHLGKSNKNFHKKRKKKA